MLRHVTPLASQRLQFTEGNRISLALLSASHKLEWIVQPWCVLSIVALKSRMLSYYVEATPIFC
jgi:hypothetical protein